MLTGGGGSGTVSALDGTEVEGSGTYGAVASFEVAGCVLECLHSKKEFKLN